MFIINTTKSWSYKDRTIENASKSNLTVAFAIDFKTRGEILTKNAVEKSLRKYCSINIQHNFQDNLDKLVNTLKTFENSNIVINVAGNSIHTLKGIFNQEDIDEYIFNIFESAFQFPINIKAIRSGGQTGADEAGAKAGIKLNIPTLVLMPSVNRIRNIEGKDIYMTEEEAYNRFKII